MEKLFQIESVEGGPKRTIVEIGPGPISLIYKVHQNEKGDFAYDSSEESFKWQKGDVYVAVDLPPFRIQDNIGNQSENMDRLKNDFKSRLPEGVKGEIVYADGTKLPFDNETVDVIFMANVISGHIKDDFREGEHLLPPDENVISEKLGILSEANRILKTGGKVIIEETYMPAYMGIVENIIDALKTNDQWKIKEIENEDSLILELTKK